MNNIFLGIMALAGTLCPKIIAENTFQNLFDFYFWSPEIWDLLWFPGWLCTIIVIIGALYSAIAWILLTVLNHTTEQSKTSKPV